MEKDNNGKWKHTEEEIRKIKTAKNTPEAKKAVSLRLKGKKLSKSHMKSLNQYYKSLTEEEKKKRVEKMCQKRLGLKATPETLKKMRNVSKGRRGYWTGKKRPSPSNNTLLKMRLSAIKYIEREGGSMRVKVGHNEKQILDDLEKIYKYKILRQHRTGGYFLDGYISELKLAIEVDEQHHNNQKEKDIKRQKYIEEKLNCVFLRVNSEVDNDICLQR